MAEILSNQFTSTVSRTAEVTTKEIVSNQFTTTINRVSEGPATLGDDLSTVINIYKKGVLLTPVSGTPTTSVHNGLCMAVGTGNATITATSQSGVSRSITLYSNGGGTTI